MPAYFDDAQRQATRDAGRLAGLEVKRIINEPTAAALAYGVNRHGSETVAVYDLGGGTFDISILQLGDGIYEVKSTSGDTYLGGEDFDKRIMDWLLDDFEKTTGIDLRHDRMALQRLKEAAEKAKCELSTATEASITLPFISADATGPKHINKILSRAVFEGLVADLIDRTAGPCKDALDSAGLRAQEIDTVILVGGQTRMPKVQERVAEIFGKAASRDTGASIDPGERSLSPRQPMRPMETATTNAKKARIDGPIGDSVKACTESSTPDRVRNVPRIVNENVATSSDRFQTRSMARRSCTITEWT